MLGRRSKDGSAPGGISGRRMTDPRTIEPIAARGWPAAESDALGGWRLHASSGQSGRINTCWPMAPPDRSADEAIAAAEDWYLRRGLNPRFKLIEGFGDPPDLAERLAARGYRPDTPTLTMVGPLRGEIDPEARVTDARCADFDAVFADPAFGHGPDALERLEALSRIPRPRGFAVIRVDGAPAAVGVCAIEAEWAGIMGMRTAPSFRRRGLARRLFRTLTAFAAAAGARRGYLQVDDDNASAIALYRAEGFDGAYLYRYWTRS
jgi:ribosomal protein S18 acetylase RimI-like enzyme